MSKTKKCKVCKTEFQPFNTIEQWCSPECALILVKKKAEKKEVDKRKLFMSQTRKMREAIKPRAKWLAEAQTACNAYIRERDKGLPCISCGNTNDVKYCAGHYKTRGGHPELRFHPMNIHRQCDWNCNLNLSGNIAEYRPNLIDKIGLKNVEWLEGGHQSQNLTIGDIAEIKQYYKDQLKILKDS